MMAWIMQSAMTESLQRTGCDRKDQVIYVIIVHFLNSVCRYVIIENTVINEL